MFLPRSPRRWLKGLVASGAISLLAQPPSAETPDRIPPSVLGAARAISLEKGGRGVISPRLVFPAYLPDRARGVLVFQGGAIFYGAKGAGLEPLEGLILPPFPGVGGEQGPGPMIGGDGGYWVVSERGLHRLQEGTWVRTSSPLPKHLQRALRWGNVWVIDKDNVLFLSTQTSMAEIFDAETWTPRWEHGYPKNSNDSQQPPEGANSGSGPSLSVRVEFMSPEIVVSGKNVVIYYHNSGRMFRLETERRNLEELDVPWVTWGRDEGKRGKAVPPEAKAKGARVEAEFPLDPFFVPVDESTIHLIGRVSGHPDLWRSCAFNPDHGDAKPVELPLEAERAADSPIQLPTASGRWVSLDQWLAPRRDQSTDPK